MIAGYALVYARLADALARPELAAIVADARAQFERACGPYAPSDPWFDERSAALADRVLTRVVGRDSVFEAVEPRDDAMSVLVEALGRAERGLFSMRRQDGHVDLECVLCGGAFRLAGDDDLAGLRAPAAGRDSSADTTAPGLIDGHVVPTPSGVMLLAGVLVHSAAATEAIVALAATEAVRAVSHAALLDAMLHLRHQLATRSRSRAHHVYRLEALSALTREA